MDFTFLYLEIFFILLELAAPLLLSMLLFIVLLGLIVGARESWKWTDSIYWAFITASTVGYGDIRPTLGFSKALSILIAFLGVILTGITVALAINAATAAFKNLHDVEQIEQVIEQELE